MDVGVRTAKEEDNPEVSDVVSGTVLDIRERGWTSEQLHAWLAANEQAIPMERITRVDLRDNRITEWDFLFRFPSLIELNINGNGLRALPAKVCELKNLDLLSCSFNPELTHLPSEIGNLRKLDYLAFSSCPIARVPQSITQLINVKSLWLNKLSSCSRDDAQSKLAEAAVASRIYPWRALMVLWMRKQEGAPQHIREMSRDVARVIASHLRDDDVADAEKRFAKWLATNV